MNRGGSAQLQIKQKAGGGHYVSVQKIVSDGVVVDDPYGEISSAYMGTSSGKGFYLRGGGVNEFDADEEGIDDDWTWQQGQTLRAEESKGNSVKYEDAQMNTDMFYSATMYGRASKAPQNT